MLPKLVTRHLPVTTLVTGHFNNKEDYFSYRPAGTDDFLMIYTLAGNGRHESVGDDFAEVLPGDLTLYAPGAHQHYGVDPARPRWEILWTHFRPRPDWLDLVDWPELLPGLGVLHLQNEPRRKEIVEQFWRVHQTNSSPDALSDRFAMNALETLLLYCQQVNPRRGSSTADPRVEQVMDLIVRKLDQKLTLNELADHSGLSVSRLSHLFRQTVGLPPMEFLERQRIERAKQLLAMTPLNVKQIAAQVGFDSQFYFSLRFKRLAGKNPSAYRRSLPRQ